jgi:CRISPR-associated protein Csh1
MTLTFINGDNEEKYLSDEPPFVNLFLRSVGDKESRYGSIGTCSICGRENVEVFGGVSPYKFFNLDKDGFLAGFSKDESYKNFPICAECIRDLNEGKDYISKNLTFTFVRGLQYQLIPQPLQDDENLQYILNIIEAQKQDTSNVINGENLQHITESENDITFLLKDAADTVSLNFLFLKVSNSAEKILALIQDVLPSRLNTLYAAKNNVESTFANLTNYDFTFGTIRQFFPSEDPSFLGGSANKVGLDKYFLDITDRIFKGRAIDSGFLFQFITNRVRAEFVKLLSNQKNNYRFITIDGLRVISFLNYLKLIRIKEVKMEQRQFDGFFKNFGSLFQDPLKRGLFLLGAATQMLLDVQNNVRGSAPFLKQLKSLRMNERDFKELLVKVQDKVNEYENVTSNQKDHYKLEDARTFLREASYYLLQSQKFDMSVPEINFYFACGMNLSQDLVSHLVSSLVSQKSEEGENESD